MRKIDITNIKPELLSGIDNNASDWDLYEQAIDANTEWQIVWHAESGRAGLIFVGSGSDGLTHWTDATSPEDAYQRLQNDELSA